MGVHVWKGACRSSIIHGNTRHFPSFCIMPSMWLSKEVLSIYSRISARLHRFCSNCDFDLQRFGRTLLQLSRRQQQCLLTISSHGRSYLALWGLSHKPIDFASQSLLRYPYHIRNLVFNAWISPSGHWKSYYTTFRTSKVGQNSDWRRIRNNWKIK